MSLLLPGGAPALFRRRSSYARGDIVLVRHPEHGTLVRRVHVATRRGRYTLEPLCERQRIGIGTIEPDWVRGRLVCRLL